MCESQARCGIARSLTRNRSTEFAGKILIFPQTHYLMDIKKELEQKIKRIRQKTGLTQEQFAEKINVATRTLAGIEIGESFVSAKTIENILDFANITLEDFFISSHLRPTEYLINDIYIIISRV